MVTQKSNKSKHQELLMAPAYKKAGSDCFIFLNNKKSNEFSTIIRMLCYRL